MLFMLLSNEVRLKSKMAMGGRRAVWPTKNGESCEGRSTIEEKQVVLLLA